MPSSRPVDLDTYRAAVHAGRIYDPRFTEVSPFAVDEGEIIGKTPDKISVSDLRLLGHPESPIKAIRSKCRDCAANEAEIRKCVQYRCPLWPMRMGVNPFHGKAA